MPDECHVDLEEKFGNEVIPIVRGDLSIKHESVEKFITFLESEQNAEKRYCPPDKLPILERIKGEKFQDMSKKINQAMARMMASDGPMTKKIESVDVVDI